ncbi:hypothetical protein [Dyadobacter pollutisoli]|uniref:DUF3784 domain-containing protein n=1 Tax=Dyadobacter pollutisoli TaxID=2910158 RepID=A0A9E8N5R0_9BACT|nr:hypothetical protein [Dyadobacter pollutisoli]WAC09253.1 hypothetical protein ON006_15985 [Dyadobacter pollutisoli]
MKKILLILSTALFPTLANAQTQGSMHIDRDQIALAVTVLIIAVILAFLLELVKRYLDYRLKEKVVESGVTQELASLLLHRDQQDLLRTCIKWLAIFLGLACGFTIVAVAQLPIWGALAVIAFCLSGGFLGYYLFLKKSVH